jgi:hypothetical protein
MHKIHYIEVQRVNFTDFGKLNLVLVAQFNLDPIYTTASAASKNDARFKSGQNGHQNNHPASLI